MGYKVAAKQPKPRPDDVAWTDAAPGLYPGEVLVALESGRFAALSVEIKWQTAGNGVDFVGTARWCDASGETTMSPDGQHVETALAWTADPVTVATYGGTDLAPLQKEVLLALMGEDPELMLDLPAPQEKEPVVNISRSVRLAASIRHAIESVAATSAAPHPAALLS